MVAIRETLRHSSARRHWLVCPRPGRARRPPAGGDRAIGPDSSGSPRSQVWGRLRSARDPFRKIPP
jgi:hypothetical protein